MIMRKLISKQSMTSKHDLHEWILQIVWGCELLPQHLLPLVSCVGDCGCGIRAVCE
jgi:hypothetical protein